MIMVGYYCYTFSFFICKEGLWSEAFFHKSSPGQINGVFSSPGQKLGPQELPRPKNEGFFQITYLCCLYMGVLTLLLQGKISNSHSCDWNERELLIYCCILFYCVSAHFLFTGFLQLDTTTMVQRDYTAV